jgi:hypothetical protein
MWKQLLFFTLRSAIGFVLIAPIFIYMTAQTYVPAEAYQDPQHPVYIWFFNGVLLAWLAGTIASVLPFAGYTSGKLRRVLKLAPIFLPLIYAAAAYLWFFRNQIL